MWVNPLIWTFTYWVLLPSWVLAGFIAFYSGEYYYGESIEPWVSTQDTRQWFTSISFHLLSCLLFAYWAHVFFHVRNRTVSLILTLVETCFVLVTGVLFWVQFMISGVLATPMMLGALGYFIVAMIEVVSPSAINWNGSGSDQSRPNFTDSLAEGLTGNVGELDEYTRFRRLDASGKAGAIHHENGVRFSGAYVEKVN